MPELHNLKDILQHDPYRRTAIIDLLTVLGTSFLLSLSVVRIVFSLQLYVKLSNNNKDKKLTCNSG